jgi:DNA repair protein RadC
MSRAPATADRGGDPIPRDSRERVRISPEVVKAALPRNAAAVVFFHNDPSGISEPSQANEIITSRLKEALALVDVRVLGHLIVAESIFSLAEHALT